MKINKTSIAFTTALSVLWIYLCTVHKTPISILFVGSVIIGMVGAWVFK